MRPTDSRSIELEWASDPRLNALWLLEHAAAEKAIGRRPGFTAALGRFASVDRRQLETIERYRHLRDRAVANPTVASSPSAPLGAELVPADDTALVAPRMLLASRPGFRAHDDLGKVIQGQADAWRHLTTRSVFFCAALEREAARVRLGSFLGKVRRLLVGNLADGATRVRIVPMWVPRPVNAAAVDTTVLLPVADGQLVSRSGLADALATAAHEFGHVCAAALPHSKRVELTNLILSRGLPNTYHRNLVDEAIHTAIGNRVFRSTTYSDVERPVVSYGYEGESEYPYAIDQVARRLEPTAAAALDSGSDSYEVLVRCAIDAQAAVVTALPAHFARVCFAHSGDAMSLKLFSRTFPGLRRWEVLRDSPAFARLIAANPTLPRWSLVLEPGDAPAADQPASIARCIRKLASADGVRAFAFASVPDADGRGAVAFHVQARTLGDMRDVLCRLHQHPSLPSAHQPLVLRFDCDHQVVAPRVEL